VQPLPQDSLVLLRKLQLSTLNRYGWNALHFACAAHRYGEPCVLDSKHLDAEHAELGCRQLDMLSSLLAQQTISCRLSMCWWGRRRWQGQEVLLLGEYVVTEWCASVTPTCQQWCLPTHLSRVWTGIMQQKGSERAGSASVTAYNCLMVNTSTGVMLVVLWCRACQAAAAGWCLACQRAREQARVAAVAPGLSGQAAGRRTGGCTPNMHSWLAGPCCSVVLC